LLDSHLQENLTTLIAACKSEIFKVDNKFHEVF